MSEQVTATKLLFDEHELARRARTTLAGAEHGRLVIADGGTTRFRECQVTVTDDGGEAVLGSDALGSVAVAAAHNAHAALMLESNQEFGVGLTLIGRISLLSEHNEREPGKASIALSVERVLTSCPHGSTGQPRREISLVSYAAAEPDSIAAHGRRIAQHLTEDHQAQVRTLLAHCTRLPVSVIAAAQVSRITAKAIDFWWLDVEGAHEFTIAFDPPAVDLAELGYRIRGLMEHQH